MSVLVLILLNSQGVFKTPTVTEETSSASVETKMDQNKDKNNGVNKDYIIQLQGEQILYNGNPYDQNSIIEVLKNELVDTVSIHSKGEVPVSTVYGLMKKLDMNNISMKLNIMEKK